MILLGLKTSHPTIFTDEGASTNDPNSQTALIMQINNTATIMSDRQLNCTSSFACIPDADLELPKVSNIAMPGSPPLLATQGSLPQLSPQRSNAASPFKLP